MINSKRWATAALNCYGGPFILDFRALLYHSSLACTHRHRRTVAACWDRIFGVYRVGRRGCTIWELREEKASMVFNIDMVHFQFVSSIWHRCPWAGLWSLIVVKAPSLSFYGALVAMASEADRCLWGVVGKSQDLQDPRFCPRLSVSFFSQSFIFTVSQMFYPIALLPS